MLIKNNRSMRDSSVDYRTMKSSLMKYGYFPLTSQREVKNG
jgi:hypothetical protein